MENGETNHCALNVKVGQSNSKLFYPGRKTCAEGNYIGNVHKKNNLGWNCPGHLF